MCGFSHIEGIRSLAHNPMKIRRFIVANSRVVLGDMVKGNGLSYTRYLRRLSVVKQYAQYLIVDTDAICMLSIISDVD